MVLWGLQSPVFGTALEKAARSYQGGNREGIAGVPFPPQDDAWHDDVSVDHAPYSEPAASS
jgi:hypothetical protein